MSFSKTNAIRVFAAIGASLTALALFLDGKTTEALGVASAALSSPSFWK